MKNITLLIALILSVGYSNAQNSNGIVTGKTTDQVAYNDGEHLQNHKALIIPFESKMYMSGIDKEISAKTGMSFEQIRQNMRFGLSNMMMTEMHDKMETVSLMHVDTGDVEKELGYIYSSIGYHYSEIPEEQLIPVEAIAPDDDAATKDKLKYKLNKFSNNVKNKVSSIGSEKEEAPKKSSGTVNGEVVTTYDKKQRYMETSIHNPNLLTQLNTKFGADVFIFINQMDIVNGASPSQKGLATDEYNRKIKVHYTIFDLSGKKISTGASISYFSNNTNDMNVIIKSHLGGIAQNIASTTVKKEDEVVKKEVEKDKPTRAEEKEERLKIEGN
ncbi:MAG: hypothetical protein ACI9J3_000753 [Parvicellaceae bacterium]|jgi:hypothetical protein